MSNVKISRPILERGALGLPQLRWVTLYSCNLISDLYGTLHVRLPRIKLLVRACVIIHLIELQPPTEPQKQFVQKNLLSKNENEIYLCLRICIHLYSIRKSPRMSDECTTVNKMILRFDIYLIFPGRRKFFTTFDVQISIWPMIGIKLCRDIRNQKWSIQISFFGQKLESNQLNANYPPIAPVQ